ncbi:hypothetical protein [Endozoicomonas sp. 2B-B]
METITLEQYIKEAQAKRSSILDTSDRGKSAYALASMALEHGSSSAEAAGE